MTCSVGFNTSGRDELAREVLQRMLDGADTDERGPLYRDPGLAATTEPGRIPAELQDYAVDDLGLPAAQVFPGHNSPSDDGDP